MCFSKKSEKSEKKMIFTRKGEKVVNENDYRSYLERDVYIFNIFLIMKALCSKGFERYKKIYLFYILYLFGFSFTFPFTPRYIDGVG